LDVIEDLLNDVWVSDVSDDTHSAIKKRQVLQIIDAIIEEEQLKARA